MKNLGIWTLDLSNENVEHLRKLGFNALVFQMGWFYDRTQGDFKQRRKDAIVLMYLHYKYAKSLGFQYFLIDVGWSLGLNEDDYFYRDIIKKFRDNEDCVFYFGEPIEGFIETGLYDWDLVYKNIQDRYALIRNDNDFVMDATIRNYNKLADWTGMYNNISISSYFGQHKHWKRCFPMVWIYGQLKFDGSLRFKMLANKADELGINTRLLYQGDPDKFDIKTPYTWLNWLIKVIGLKNSFLKWQQERFIKYNKATK